MEYVTQPTRVLYPGSTRAVPDTRVDFDSDTQCTRPSARVCNKLPKGRVR